MADLRDLVDAVEGDPDDHPQRWRLVKKLYMECEYRDALSHLLVLRDEWPDRLNVVRYLGATYYRLGQYEDAINEIQAAIKLWPREVPLREQLARSLEVAERPDEAKEVWQEVLGIQPDHPMAAHTIDRLEGGAQDPSSADLHLAQSDSGIDLAQGLICPGCGARNSADFERCWQCHAALLRVGTPTPAISPPTSSPASLRWLWTLSAGAATVVLLCVGVFLTLQQLSTPRIEDGRFIVAASAGQLLSHEWLYARLATGLALLAAWPAAIWLGALLCCDARQKPRKLVGAGLFLAALTHLFLWAPVNLLVLASLAPLLVSLVVTWMACSGKTGRLLGVWAFQAVVVATVGAGTFIANTGVAPFKDFAALTQAPSAGKKAEAGARTALPTADVPATYRLVWRSTGSRWLDSMGRLVHFEITPTDPSLPLYVEFREAGQIFRSNTMEEYPYGFTHQIVPGRSYSLSVSGDASTQVSVTVQSLFTLVPESP